MYSVLSSPEGLVEPQENTHPQRAALQAAGLLSPSLAGRPQEVWTVQQQRGRPSSRLMLKAAPRKAAPRKATPRKAALPAQQAQLQEQQVERTCPVAQVTRGTRTRTTAWRSSFCIGILWRKLFTTIYYRYLILTTKLPT